MKRGRKGYFHPAIEFLEGRCLLAGLPWPIANVTDLLSTYGQYQESGGLHFHAGIDILAAAGTAVMAHPKSSATQHRKNNPRNRLGFLDILFSLSFVRAFSSSFVFAL
jgi:hypothetical protein